MKKDFQSFLSGYETAVFPDLVRDASELIRIPSITGKREELYRALDFLRIRAETLGLRARIVCGGRIGEIEMGAGEETVGILSHVDVVPPGPEELWDTPPFSGIIDAGFLCGRGAIDVKGPTLASLYALAAVKASGCKIYKKARLILGTQEEGSWEDMEDYCSLFPLPDYGFTPDGEFPVCNREKGYMDIRLFFPCPGGTDKVLAINGGESLNTIPDRCAVTIPSGGRAVEISYTGKSAHSSRPDKGENAITKACQDLSEKLTDSSPAKTMARFMAANFHGDFSGNIFGMDSMERRIPGEDMGKTAVSPTFIVTRPDGWEVNINCRTSYGVIKEKVEKVLSDLCSNNGFQYSFGVCQDPLYVPRNRPYIEPMNGIYKRITGREGGFFLGQGTSYAKAMPEIVCWGPLFPEDPDLCHEPNEKLSLETLRLCFRIYAELLYTYLCCKKSYKA